LSAGSFVRYAEIVHPVRHQPEDHGNDLHRPGRRNWLVQAMIWKSLREKQRPEVLQARILSKYGKWEREGDV
jgi:error-prone DNA polymerase